LKGDFYIASNEVAFMKPLNFPLLAATDTGVPRPGNWVGFLFQNSASPYEVPNALVNTKHVAQTFYALLTCVVLDVSKIVSQMNLLSMKWHI
jgi:hypothetical protein